MADYTALIQALNVSINQRITQKTTVDSIDPVDIGGSITDFSDLLLPILNTINNFDILTGIIPPDDATDGQDDDEYLEFGTQFKVYKKTSGTWILKATGNIGVTIQDGNINLQSSVNGNIVRISPGQWGIDNVIYAKGTQTEFPTPAAHPTFDRIDAVFADNIGGGTINYVTGTASLSPSEPATPANNVLVAYVYIPSTASGNLPYIADSNVPSAPTSGNEILLTESAEVSDGEDGWYIPASSIGLPANKMIVGVLIQPNVGDDYVLGSFVGDITGLTDNDAKTIRIKYL